jgi:hypothetical protein
VAAQSAALSVGFYVLTRLATAIGKFCGLWQGGFDGYWVLGSRQLRGSCEYAEALLANGSRNVEAERTDSKNFMVFIFLV